MSFSITHNELQLTTAKINQVSRESSSSTWTQYSILGLVIELHTQKESGYYYYKSNLLVRVDDSTIDNSFLNWVDELLSKLTGSSPRPDSTWYRKNKIQVAKYDSERASVKACNLAHERAELIAESYVLAMINKYVEITFNELDKEVINRQIADLQSQLATIN